MNATSVLFLLGLVSLLSSCASPKTTSTANQPPQTSATAKPPTKVWSVSPNTASVDRPDYQVTITPYGKPESGYLFFALAITNKSKKPIEVNWNKTLYVVNNQTQGGFMFDGIVYRDRNNQKPPDIVFAGTTWSKGIMPNILVAYASGRFGGWYHESMPQGDNGIYLALSVDGKEVNERLGVTVYKQ